MLLSRDVRARQPRGGNTAFFRISFFLVLQFIELQPEYPRDPQNVLKVSDLENEETLKILVTNRQISDNSSYPFFFPMTKKKTQTLLPFQQLTFSDQ